MTPVRNLNAALRMAVKLQLSRPQHEDDVNAVPKQFTVNVAFERVLAEIDRHISSVARLSARF